MDLSLKILGYTTFCGQSSYSLFRLPSILSYYLLIKRVALCQRPRRVSCAANNPVHQTEYNIFSVVIAMLPDYV